MKKFLTFLLVLSFILIVFAETVEIAILHTSDFHGNIYPINYATNKPSDVGLAKVAKLIKQVKSKFKNVILIDSDDLIQGTPLEYYHAKVDNEPIAPMILVMKKLGYSA